MTDQHPEVETALEWFSDAAAVVNHTGEAPFVPSAPDADSMWELGKLCSERIGLIVTVNRAGRRQGIALDARTELDRHFLLRNTQIKTWPDVLVFEAIVGPFFRLFFESFFRSASADLDALAHELWEHSQRFIRFGQAHLAKALGGPGHRELEEALERWLPAVLGALDEVPADVDASWTASGLRTRSVEQVRTDYVDEIITYLHSNELEVPAAVAEQFKPIEVKWLGTEVGGAARQSEPLQPAGFFFTDRLSGRSTAAAGDPTDDETE